MQSANVRIDAQGLESGILRAIVSGMPFDSTTFARTINDTYISELAPKSSPMRKKVRAARSRQVNYRSESTPATLRKQAAIRELLANGIPFTVRAIGEALGMSRQLTLYHVKKMAATHQLVMVLEPCEVNGGLQYRVWDEGALMAHYMLKGQAILRAREVAA